MPDQRFDASATGFGGSFGSGLIGGSTDGRISTGGTGGTGPVDAGIPSGTVSITIVSPAGGTLLSNNLAADVSARVSIMGGTDIIDPSTVRVSLVPAGGTGAVSAAPLVGPTAGNLFTGKLSLAGLATGDYTLFVTARSSTNVDGSAMEAVKIDGGPKITVVSPIPGHHYKGSIIVQAIVDPGSFPPASAPQATIAGTPVTLQPTTSPMVFRGVFDLTMPNALTDDQLFEISATDARGTVTDLRFIFNVDTIGPSITMTTPIPGAIVGQVVRFAATISDPAGLDASSIQVLIGDKNDPQFKLPLTLESAGVYSTLFDTRLLTQCKLKPASGLCIVRPTISFRAADALGNETINEYEIAVDNLPPIADLQPPKIRATKIDKGLLRCSFAMDPLSVGSFVGDAPKDGCRVPQLFDLRARIEDTGNYATGLKQMPIAGVDPAKTAAYILADTSQPLVVDIDGDGNCDAINPHLVPTTAPLTGAPREVLKVRLRPVPPAGAADFTMDSSIPPTADCAPGADPDPPKPICRVEQPTLAISYAGGVSAIWAVEPIAPDDPRYCFGSQLDTLANNVPDSGNDPKLPGWRCLAIATADLNGNISTSMPLRVWVDYNFGGPFCGLPAPTNPPMPTCTGTFDKATDMVTSKACKARTFNANSAFNEECFENDCAFCASFPSFCQ
jgi:hypothetical protein